MEYASGCLAQRSPWGQCHVNRANSDQCCPTTTSSRLVYTKGNAPGTAWMASAQMATRNFQSDVDTFAQTTTQPPRAPPWVAFSIRTHNIKLLSPQLLQLFLPQARTTRYRESFFYRSALLWNSLPQDIQAHTNTPLSSSAISGYVFLSSGTISSYLWKHVIPPPNRDPLDQGTFPVGESLNIKNKTQTSNDTNFLDPDVVLNRPPLIMILKFYRDNWLWSWSFTGTTDYDLEVLPGQLSYNVLMHVLIWPPLSPYRSIVPAKLQDPMTSPSFTKSPICQDHSPSERGPALHTPRSLGTRSTVTMPHPKFRDPTARHLKSARFSIFLTQYSGEAKNVTRVIENVDQRCARKRDGFLIHCTHTAWCSEIGSLMSLMHTTQVHPVTSENQFHCTRLYEKRSTVWRHISERRSPADTPRPSASTPKMFIAEFFANRTFVKLQYLVLFWSVNPAALVGICIGS